LKIELSFLQREGENLIVDKSNVNVEALVDEGGHGFEPSLYIIGQKSGRVCQIVENLAKSMELMA